jgi:hypothetical protein
MNNNNNTLQNKLHNKNINVNKNSFNMNNIFHICFDLCISTYNLKLKRSKLQCPVYFWTGFLCFRSFYGRYKSSRRLKKKYKPALNKKFVKKIIFSVSNLKKIWKSLMVYIVRRR